MKRLFSYIGLAMMFISVGCYRDKVEELHPKSTGGCDTVTITYSKTIVPIMNTYCVSCHSGPGAKKNISLDKHSGFSNVIADGSLIGSITFDPNYVTMPEGATHPIDSCYIKQIILWVKAGAPNN